MQAITLIIYDPVQQHRYVALGDELMDIPYKRLEKTAFLKWAFQQYNLTMLIMHWTIYFPTDTIPLVFVKKLWIL